MWSVCCSICGNCTSTIGRPSLLELVTLDHPLITQIENHKYLLSQRIFPVEGSRLVFQIAEAAPMGDPHVTVVGIKGVETISTPRKAKRYTFTFEDFVAYSVTSEMYAQEGKDEIFEGRRVRIYSQSAFLTFVSATTWATDDFPGPLHHYQVNTLDHSIDVVTANPPRLRISGSTE